MPRALALLLAARRSPPRLADGERAPGAAVPPRRRRPPDVPDRVVVSHRPLADSRGRRYGVEPTFFRQGLEPVLRCRGRRRCAPARSSPRTSPWPTSPPAGCASPSASAASAASQRPPRATSTSPSTTRRYSRPGRRADPRRRRPRRRDRRAPRPCPFKVARPAGRRRPLAQGTGSATRPCSSPTATSGEWRLGDGARSPAVHGEAWFDHEWGTSQLGAGVVGWDWFGLRLADGRDLMLYRLRRADGGAAHGVGRHPGRARRHAAPPLAR